VKLKQRTLSELAESWGKSAGYAALKPRTRDFYAMALRPILLWKGDSTASRINRGAIHAFLAGYDDRPAMRNALRATLSQLFQHGLRTNAVAENPADGVRLRRTKPKREVQVWEPSDVLAYENAARALSWPHGALLIRLMYETTADQTDIVTWTPENFQADEHGVTRVTFRRGKTGERRSIPVSADVAAHIATLPAGKPIVLNVYGDAYIGTKQSDDARMWLMRRVRDAVVSGGGRRLLYDHLRHSGASEAVDKGGSYEDVRALTGHASTDVLERCYVQQSTSRLDAIQRSRGII
jgi:integrase